MRVIILINIILVNTFIFNRILLLPRERGRERNMAIDLCALSDTDFTLDFEMIC